MDGSKMILWEAFQGRTFNEGGIYDPVTYMDSHDHNCAPAENEAPDSKHLDCKEMIIWEARLHRPNIYNTGGKYNRTLIRGRLTNWRAISTSRSKCCVDWVSSIIGAAHRYYLETMVENTIPSQ